MNTDRTNRPGKDPEREPSDDVATLLRLAGARPPVPADTAARVKAVASTHWRSEVRRRSRRKTLWTAAALAAAAAVAAAISPGLIRHPRAVETAIVPAMHVESAVGSVWLAPSSLLRIDDTVSIGSIVVTERAGRAALRLASGESVRLDSDSRLRFLSAYALALDRGAIYVDSQPRAGGASNPLVVHTPAGIVRERGTQFEVRLQDESVRIRVREGAVVLSSDEASYEIGSGSELDVNETGVTQRREASTYGTGWLWIEQVTPMPDLEGRSVRAFLDWIARERGLRLTFADGALAKSASEIMMSGSIAGLSLDEALEAVLATCRMTHGIEQGTLIIHPLTKSG